MLKCKWAGFKNENCWKIKSYDSNKTFLNMKKIILVDTLEYSFYVSHAISVNFICETFLNFIYDPGSFTYDSHLWQLRLWHRVCTRRINFIRIIKHNPISFITSSPSAILSLLHSVCFNHGSHSKAWRNCQLLDIYNV